MSSFSSNAVDKTGKKVENKRPLRLAASSAFMSCHWLSMYAPVAHKMSTLQRLTSGQVLRTICVGPIEIHGIFLGKMPRIHGKTTVNSRSTLMSMHNK